MTTTTMGVQVNARRVAGIALGIVGAVFLVLSLLGFGAAGTFYVLEANSGRTAKADGVIAEADYRALVQFTTASGQTVQFRNGVNDTSYVGGQHVPVVYDPADPQGAAVDAFAGRWFLVGLFALLGGPFLAVGLVLNGVGWVLRRAAARTALVS